MCATAASREFEPVCLRGDSRRRSSAGARWFVPWAAMSDGTSELRVPPCIPKQNSRLANKNISTYGSIFGARAVSQLDWARASAVSSKKSGPLCRHSAMVLSERLPSPWEEARHTQEAEQARLGSLSMRSRDQPPVQSFGDRTS